MSHNLTVALDPAAEYTRRLEQRRATVSSLRRTDRRYSYARLVVFGAAVLLAVLAWQGLATAWLVLLPVIAFVILARRHERAIRARRAAEGAVAFYERGLARIEDRWAGTGESGDRFKDDHHLYVNDLDLFGHGSLFELLSVARTRAGEAVLARWLAAAAAADEIRSRQACVTELTGGLDLREALAVSGSDVRAGVHPDELRAWAEAPALLAPAWVRWCVLGMTAVVVGTAALWVAGGPELYLLVALALQAGFAWPQMRRVERALHGAAAVARDLDVLGHLLTRLERERFEAPRLQTLRRALDANGASASSVIGALRRLVEMHDWQHNLIFLMLSLPLLWGTHVAWAIEAWRARHGLHIRQWLDAVAEIEALSSLSAYRFEHPTDPFPAIVVAADETASPVFDAVALGHPLIPSAKAVRNDVRLDDECRLLVVSGSNMSGKSTLLRTVGINAVLALAGAPVRASSLRISPVAIGATLRIQDSLQEGRSRFYAEITRLRELFDVANSSSPLLFLLDELFHGTNSHDRLVGASALLQSLVTHRAVGLVTTHDLALTEIVNALAPHAVNVHFEDRFENGEIRFDYRMKPGPVTHSNALALMRAVGLDVPED